MYFKEEQKCWNEKILYQINWIFHVSWFLWLLPAINLSAYLIQIHLSARDYVYLDSEKKMQWQWSWINFKSIPNQEKSVQSTYLRYGEVLYANDMLQQIEQKKNRKIYWNES